MRPQASLLQTGANSGPFNMGLDEALWLETAERQTAWMRLYQWDRPTLSLGYFQSSSDAAAVAIDTVRRLTGGGAIVHDDELTYSMSLPGATARSAAALYRDFHQAVAARLRRFGVPIQFSSAGDPGPFFCFEREDEFALCLAGRKILGSAQRRRPAAVLMHGSLIRSASTYCPQATGLDYGTAVRLGKTELTATLAGAFEEATGYRLQPTELSDSLNQAARHLAATKHSAAWWVHKGKTKQDKEVGGEGEIK